MISRPAKRVGIIDEAIGGMQRRGMLCVYRRGTEANFDSRTTPRRVRIGCDRASEGCKNTSNNRGPTG